MTISNLTELMNELYSRGYGEFCDRQKILLDILQKNGYWPTLQFKKFLDNSGLVLIYNSQKMNEYASTPTPAIYKECRSVVLDLLAERAQDAVVSTMYAENPVRVSDTTYESLSLPEDVLEEGYEGTTVHVYCYKDQWYYSTTGCPSIDTSRYFHPTKTHGEMFDECLGGKTREEFASHLDKDKRYMFVIIHHENRHVIDYSNLLGDRYAKLVHIQTHGKDLVSESLEEKPLAELGVLYPARFDTLEKGLTWLRSNSTSYALIAKSRDGSLQKVCREEVIFHETTDLGNSNPWHNMLWIYLQNRQDFTVANYAKKHNIPAVEKGTDELLSPTFVIHSAIASITSHLFRAYCNTTRYNASTRELSFRGDKALAPILRFHMVQLREIQRTAHSDRYLSHKSISHYLRFHQTMKNIRLLIRYFAENPDVMSVSEENKFCIRKLHELLKTN